MKDNRLLSRKNIVLKCIMAVVGMLIITVGFNNNLFLSGFDVFNRGNNQSQVALRYYLEKYGDKDNSEGVYAMNRRLGCHDEIHIYDKEGQILMKFTYSDGKVYKIE
ncbi:MAG: hypothetical protein KGZ33_01780 [Alkaliphilus sp.]|nr:hypothetical protein [Alkaliphilus sp.]